MVRQTTGVRGTECSCVIAVGTNVIRLDSRRFARMVIGATEPAMPTESGKPLIVISYAHADEPEHPAEGEVKWLSFVTGYLRPAIKHGAVDLWLDQLIPGGADWEHEIGEKFRVCDIFILLVSRHSLSSDYIVDKEIALIRGRQAKGEPVHFYPLVLTPTPKIALDLVHDKNLRPRDGKPLSDYSINERYRHMSDAADEIAAITAQVMKRAMAAAHLVTVDVSDTDLGSAVRKITDQESLEEWLSEAPREVSVAIAARAALRVAPLACAMVRTRPGAKVRRQFADLTAAIFRANALVRNAAEFRVHADEFGAAADVADAAASAAYDVGAKAAVRAAARAAYAADAAYGEAASDAADAMDAALAAARAAHGEAGADALWAELNADTETVVWHGHAAAAERPLWSRSQPGWAAQAWAALQAALPKDQDWDVWVEWYEQRLRGGSRGEGYEFVFASVPEKEWDKGPAAANAWIKAQLPSVTETVWPVELPTPVSNLETPFAYGWTASHRVTIVAGAQNLPSYSHFSSEEDHQRALETCRVGGERLLKALGDGRYNARREYGEALEYYVADLPKTAGAGNILLANDQVRILHDMFLADAAMLSEGLASRLKSVIANQFALNAFYDLVQRHNEAVSAGNWSRPFPLDAAKSFFGAVEDNTPRWFEREVEKGLRQVEQAEPPPPKAPEPTPASAIEPPPLPPGTPDAQDSWKRQMATAANGLWETFLQGRAMPVDRDEWRKAADELGPHVRPIIDFLREQAR
jgi:hypothetical protein